MIRITLYYAASDIHILFNNVGRDVKTKRRDVCLFNFMLNNFERHQVGCDENTSSLDVWMTTTNYTLRKRLYLVRGKQSHVTKGYWKSSNLGTI